MIKQKVIYQLINLINNFDFSSNEKNVLLDYFSRLSKARQTQNYIILLKNPEFLGRLLYFIIKEKESINANDEEILLRTFSEEFTEVENI